MLNPVIYKDWINIIVNRMNKRDGVQDWTFRLKPERCDVSLVDTSKNQKSSRKSGLRSGSSQGRIRVLGQEK